MKTIRLVLWDQLSFSLCSLEGYEPQTDIILMCETREDATYVHHHKKKIAFLWSAMRHFAEELRQAGFVVHYIRFDDPQNTGTLEGELKRLQHLFQGERIVATHPGEYRILSQMKGWESALGVPVEIRPDNRFLCTPETFEKWAMGRQSLRMEYFYREMRKAYGILMDGPDPMGGQWNFDAQNRKPPQEGLRIPAPYQNPLDEITQEVIDLVAQHFPDHFGDLMPFGFAVNRGQALEVLDLFIRERLPFFGDYQDAMIQGEPWMYHSHLSFYINCGLLLPLECVRAAENAYLKGEAPLNAVEGFIRQIIGWREYVRGIYWLKMPGYEKENFFKATRPLPDFYWTGNTQMNCLRQCVLETKENAYAHHIQRLMVLGNFALLAGIDPVYVNEWFLIVYADAYEWVEMPNVTGMILFADGGYLASKPYAAGGGYIDKMSNYCRGCSYRVTVKNGPKACPFNYLYWDFLARHRERLGSNHRLGMMYKTYDKMDEEKKIAIGEDSRRFLSQLS